MTQLRLLAGAGLVLVACTGCNIFGTHDRVCTLIGCENSLTVRFDRPLTAPARLEVSLSAPGSPPLYAEDCDATRCSGGAYFPGLVADHVWVRIIIGSTTKDYELRPTYVDSFPNGPACGSPCQQATVQVQLPA
jgi:hypothetical protein